MIESTALRHAVTHMLCCSWAMCFSAAASSVQAHGSMNLASKTAPVCSTMPSSAAAIHLCTGCRTRFWMSEMVYPVERWYPARLRTSVIVPSWTRNYPRDFLARALHVSLAKASELVLIVTHDDTRIRAAD